MPCSCSCVSVYGNNAWSVRKNLLKHEMYKDRLSNYTQHHAKPQGITDGFVITRLHLNVDQNGLWGVWVTTEAGTAPGATPPRGSDTSWSPPRGTTSPGGATTRRSWTWTTSPDSSSRVAGSTANSHLSGSVTYVLVLNDIHIFMQG